MIPYSTNEWGELQVKALQPPSPGIELQKLLENTYKRVKKFKVWSHPDKQERLKSLLAEMEALIAEDK
ncbi:MAG: hypothetical protein QNJ36_10810 [Calothrix sp. MO_167.B42]|nr:hypothetical protein [Calothrix sp. MO_167.B42]